MFTDTKQFCLPGLGLHRRFRHLDEIHQRRAEGQLVQVSIYVTCQTRAAMAVARKKNTTQPYRQTWPPAMTEFNTPFLDSKMQLSGKTAETVSGGMPTLQSRFVYSLQRNTVETGLGLWPLGASKRRADCGPDTATPDRNIFRQQSENSSFRTARIVISFKDTATSPVSTFPSATTMHSLPGSSKS